MSVFIFNVIRNLDPTRLACEFIIRSYVNERYPDQLTLFDLSHSRIGKKSITNPAKHVVDKWNFDWLTISIVIPLKASSEHSSSEIEWSLS